MPNEITTQVTTILNELIAAGNIRKNQLVVIGVSTSEVIGERIGTSGTEEVAQLIYDGVETVRERVGFYPMFQCCEHLNRALVVGREALQLYPLLEEVRVIPVPRAGGSMAALAYCLLQDAVVIESVQAHAGVDIGDTLVGMHLKRVAVPVRPSIRTIGHAHVNMAITRPKLIGGERAMYK
jgi:uncharacterized protein (TIGR01440 family)